MKRLMMAMLAVMLAATAWAGTAYFKRETVCGNDTKKYCVYDYYGKEVFSKANCTDLCPLTIVVQ